MSKKSQTRHLTPALSETLLTLLETLPDALFVLDDAATIVYANARAQAMTGATREQLCGQPLWRGAHQLVSTVLYQAVQKIKQARTPGEVAYRSPVKETWLHVSLSPTEQGLALFFQEHREPPPLQHALSSNEQMYQDLLESFADGVTIVTPNGLVLDINQRPLADGHLQREEVVGKPFTDLPAWSSDPAVQQRLRAAIARASRGETVRFEARIHPRTDLYLDMLMTITSHRDASQQVEYLICAGRDITERKRAEDDLRVLIDAIPQFVWILGPDGASEYGNQRWCDYTAMTFKQYQGDGWLQAVHPDDRQRTLRVWRHACVLGEPFEIEYRLKNGHTGIYCWFLARAMPVREEGGQILKWFGTCTDIEDQKQLEEALRQSQERANVLMNSSFIGINVIEGEQIVDANDTFLRMTGYTREDLRAGRLNVMHITAPEDQARTRQAHQELANQHVLTPYEKAYICQDGSRLPVLVGGVVLQHHPSQVIGFVLDNSARNELEQRKDAFISMASHELRNPLTALKLQTTLLHRQLARQGTLDQAPALASMETQIKTITRLVEELLDVSKIQAGKLEYVQEPVDLDALLREITDTMQHTHPSYRILVRGAVQTSLTGDRDRLGQVFINLLSNAIKYSPNAQTVEMDLSASEDVVTVRVRDYGLGIPRELRDKIFERFYRVTDPKQKRIAGLGMGLYIVAEIVKGHGGTITVDSDVGKGSTFTVTFPRRREA